MVPRVVLMKSGLVSINTARQNISKTAVSVNTARQVNAAHTKTTVNAARPMSYLFKTTHSTVKRPIHKNTTFKNSNINQKVNTVRGKNLNTAKPKAVVNTVEGIFINTSIKAKTINGDVQLHALVDGKKIIITESTVRRDLQLEDAEGVDYLQNSTIFEQLTLMSPKTTAWNEFSITMAPAIICLATNQKFNFSKFIFEELGEGSANPTDPHHTPTITQSSTQPQKTQKPRKPKRKDTQVPQPSDPSENIEDEAAHKELGDSLVRAATTASSLEAEWWSQNEIDSLKRRVKKLEKKRSSRTHKLKRLYKVGLIARVESSGDEEDLDKDASKQGRRINAINADEDITLVNVQDDADNEMFDVNVLNGEEVFFAGQNENVVEEVVDAAQVSTATTTVTITTEEITLAQSLEALKTSKTKGKGIMIEEPVKPMKKKDLIRLDEEVALKLQAEFDEEERLAREKAEKEKEANIALIEEWDDIQAKIDADYQLAERMQAQEQEELSDAEKATLFQQLLEKRRKHFAAKRAEEKRNKPPTKAQQKKIMSFKRVNISKDFRTELVEGKEKRAGEELIQESSKKIVDWKIHKERKKSYYQIIRADGKSQMYMVFSHILKSFDREDLEDLYKLVKARYGSTRTVESMDYLLWNDMKIIFEPHVEDAIYMLIEKKYPLTPPTLSMMLEKKLQIDYESEMAYQLCKLIIK
ncbi:hypothetical protein Tco_0542743 [Tanacetum coccineum]